MHRHSLRRIIPAKTVAASQFADLEKTQEEAVVGIPCWFEDSSRRVYTDKDTYYMRDALAIFHTRLLKDRVRVGDVLVFNHRPTEFYLVKDEKVEETALGAASTKEFTLVKLSQKANRTNDRISDNAPQSDIDESDAGPVADLYSRWK